ncbi:MAG: DUF1028 domain-containing protein [Bacteroidales bacterium]|nr:DUF1028 domain-containing protein [Bacteroidales bacterium]
MKIFLLSLLSFFVLQFAATAQDTFSIVAVDTLTGEVGSAGASCLDNSAIAGGAIIISDIIPGRGAIHTQSYWHPTNQANAHQKMLEGLSPEEIINWLENNDVQNQPGRRQYGIVDFDEAGSSRSAAFTGVNCMDWKGHYTGANYSIQGNILLGQAIIDSIEARFLRTEGSLADKLMAALQGANVVGADTRCAPEGVSSLSAFLRVAQADNEADSLYLDLNVPETPDGVEPIDELQTLYNEWLNWVGQQEKQADNQLFEVFPNPAQQWVQFRHTLQKTEQLEVELLDLQGRLLEKVSVDNSSGRINVKDIKPGLYILNLKQGERVLASRKIYRSL